MVAAAVKKARPGDQEMFFLSRLPFWRKKDW